MNGKKPVYGVKGNKPVISGNNNRYPTGTIPVYSGLIDILDRDYVTLENVKILRSHGHGIRLEGDITTGKSTEYFTIDNCDIVSCYGSAILVCKCAKNFGIIRNCYITDNGLAGNWRLKLYSTHPGIVSVAHCPYANTVIEGCTTYQNWGETYIVWTGDNSSTSHSGHVTIQDCSDLGRGLVYIDGVENITFRRNMIIGGNWEGSDQNGVLIQRSGIYISNEDYPSGTRKSDVTRNIWIYNNLIGDVSIGIMFGTETSNDIFRNIHVFNNTLIGNYRSFRNFNSSTNFVNVSLRNNAVYFPPGTVYDKNPPNLIRQDPDWVITHNGGNGPSFGSNWVSESSHWIDPYGSDWQTIDESEIFTISSDDFMIASGSKLINSAADLGATYAADYRDKKRPQGRGWDIGAFEFTNSTSKYSLTVNSGSGSGDYSEGENITITANPPLQGMVFDQWEGTVDNITKIKSSQATLVMPASNVTVRATYITGTSNSLTVNSGSGSGNYSAGTVVSITANVPSSGTTFNAWTGDISSVANIYNATTTITMPTSAAVVAATYQTAGGKNLIMNPGFESQNSSAWEVGDECTILNNSSQAHNGSYSLRIIADGTWNSASQYIAIIPGHNYEIKGYIRSENITGKGPNIRINWINGSDDSYDSDYLVGTEGTTDYQLVTLTKIAPPSSVKMSVVTYTYKGVKSGTAYFDDISVIDLNSSEP